MPQVSTCLPSTFQNITTTTNKQSKLHKYPNYTNYTNFTNYTNYTNNTNNVNVDRLHTAHISLSTLNSPPVLCCTFEPCLLIAHSNGALLHTPQNNACLSQIIDWRTAFMFPVHAIVRLPIYLGTWSSRVRHSYAPMVLFIHPGPVFHLRATMVTVVST